MSQDESTTTEQVAVVRTAVERLRSLAETATAGPWVADCGEVSQSGTWRTVVSTQVWCVSYCYGGGAQGVVREEDEQLIVALADTRIAQRLARLLERDLERFEQDLQLLALQEEDAERHPHDGHTFVIPAFDPDLLDIATFVVESLGGLGVSGSR